MIFTRCVLTLIGIISLQSTGRANLLGAKDEQTCLYLCENCDGTATFDDNVCQCHVADDNQRGAECIDRIKGQAEEFGLDVVSCDLADVDADRAARCVLSPLRRFRNRGDADLIAKYFMGNGLMGGLGSILGSTKSATGENVASSGATSDTNAETSGGNSELDSGMVGSANPYSGGLPMSGMNPLLGAAAAWLQPQNLLAIGNAYQGAGTQGFVGQQSPNSLSGATNHNYETDPMQRNMARDTASMGMYDSRNTYPAGTVLGMAPGNQYNVAGPNPDQSRDGSQVQHMPSYVDNYRSMVGAQYPSSTGDNHVGASSHWNYQTPVVGGNNPGVAVPQESSMDQSGKAAPGLLAEPKPDPSLGSKKNTDTQDKEDDSEADGKEGEGPVVSSKQTAKDLWEINPKEIKDQTIGSSNHNTKRRQSRS